VGEKSSPDGELSSPVVGIYDWRDHQNMRLVFGQVQSLTGNQRQFREFVPPRWSVSDWII